MLEMPRVRTVDVRVERGPAAVEYSSGVLPRSFVPGIGPVPRGSVRLVIDMPFRSCRLLVSGAISTALVALILGLEFFAFSFIPLPDDPRVIRWVLPGLLIGAVVVFNAFFMWSQGAFRKHEVVEIDSLFTTVTRGGQVVQTVPSFVCPEVALWEPATRLARWLQRIGWAPTIAFGSSGATYIAVGEGISQDTAEALLPRIQSFILEHPPAHGTTPTEQALQPDAHTSTLDWGS
jgi:hypothetical protein